MFAKKEHAGNAVSGGQFLVDAQFLVGAQQFLVGAAPQEKTKKIKEGTRIASWIEGATRRGDCCNVDLLSMLLSFFPVCGHTLKPGCSGVFDFLRHGNDFARSQCSVHALIGHPLTWSANCEGASLCAGEVLSRPVLRLLVPFACFVIPRPFFRHPGYRFAVFIIYGRF